MPDDVSHERARFWNLIEKRDGDDSCWDWKGYISERGVGMFRTKGGRKASRLISVIKYMWEIHHGEMPIGHVVYRTCGGNKLCVRPEHISCGTRTEMIRFMKAAKRYQPNIGESHKLSLLKEGDVLEIRRRFEGGDKGVDLAKEFGVDRRTISSIVHRRTWRHLAPA